MLEFDIVPCHCHPQISLPGLLQNALCFFPETLSIFGLTQKRTKKVKRRCKLHLMLTLTPLKFSNLTSLRANLSSNQTGCFEAFKQ